MTTATTPLPMRDERITVPTLLRYKQRGQRVVMLTCYDATFARLIDASGVDIVLVGDSLGMVIQGQDTTLPVTVEDIIYHTRAVARGCHRAHIVADMPFMSYQTSVKDGLHNAGRLIKEGGAAAVKIEGGKAHVPLIERLTQVGIPVMGHIGLTPQSVHAMGGYKVQGKTEQQVSVLIEDALAVQSAGAYSLVIEGVPTETAARITEKLEIPTIGIGAGPACDGQVLVIYDLLGMNEQFCPKFVKRYDRLAERIRLAVGAFVEDVRQGQFPAPEHCFSAGKEQRGLSQAIPLYSKVETK